MPGGTLDRKRGSGYPLRATAAAAATARAAALATTTAMSLTTAVSIARALLTAAATTVTPATASMRTIVPMSAFGPGRTITLAARLAGRLTLATFGPATAVVTTTTLPTGRAIARALLVGHALRLVRTGRRRDDLELRRRKHRHRLLQQPLDIPQQ